MASVCCDRHPEFPVSSLSPCELESFTQSRSRTVASEEEEMEWSDLPSEEASRIGEYTPGRVFSKSRFHVMGEIKRALQTQVTREYLKANSPPPST